MADSLIIRNFETVDAAFLDAHPGLRVLGVPQTGLDNVNEALCQARGVKVVSLRGERSFLDSITSTSEHTMFLLLALMRRARTNFRGDRKVGNTLAGKTLGLIGNKGRVATQVARMARGFGMRVHGVDKGSKKYVRLLKESDVVSLHVPLAGNEQWFGRVHFSLMKPTSYLINTSRTKVMQDGSLWEALRAGTIAGAAVDFMDDPQLVEYAKTNDNLILTPHCGGFTEEDRQKTDDFILEKMHTCLSI